MVVYDGIVEALQKGGGVSVVFKELLSRSANYDLICFTDHSMLGLCTEVQKTRLFERYRDCIANSEFKVFHSTYYRLPKNSTLKVVTTVHDFTYERFVKGPALWVHQWQKYRAIKRSDIVICVSENTANDLMKYCPIDESKIRVISNGVSETYRPLENLGTTNEVLFVGARGGYKNFSLAVESLANLSHLSLSIVGGGDLTELEFSKLEACLPGRYNILGRLSDEDLNKAYNRAYALLYPSSYEGFGIPVIEAMRAGCPVVAVNCSSIPEVAGDAAILIEYANADLFKEALLKVSETREELINAGLEQANKFSWNKCFQETLQVYKELM